MTTELLRLSPLIACESPIDCPKHVEDLIEYEGPLLSHFTDKDNIDWLYYWTDCDATTNRWLVTTVDHAMLTALGQALANDDNCRVVSCMRSILLKPYELPLYVLDNSNDSYTWSMTERSSLPEQYLPGDPSNIL